MIATTSMDVLLKNEHSNFEMLSFDISESDDMMEIYSEFFNPMLKRGWVGDLTYYCHRGYIVHSCDEVEDVELITIKDVLLRSVQCYKATEREATQWRYVFLKN